MFIFEVKRLNNHEGTIITAFKDGNEQDQFRTNEEIDSIKEIYRIVEQYFNRHKGELDEFKVLIVN